MPNPFTLQGTPAKVLAGVTVFAVTMWFFTSCVDAVNFDETKKQDVQGGISTAWAMTISMLVLSTLAFAAALICGSLSIYFTVKEGPAAPRSPETEAAAKQRKDDKDRHAELAKDARKLEKDRASARTLLVNQAKAARETADSVSVKAAELAKARPSGGMHMVATSVKAANANESNPNKIATPKPVSKNQFVTSDTSIRTKIKPVASDLRELVDTSEPRGLEDDDYLTAETILFP